MSATPDDSAQKQQKRIGRGKHPNSKAALIKATEKHRFQPGQSGNPGGLPKGTPKVTVAYGKLLKLSAEELHAFKPATAAEAIAYRQVMSAIYGERALSAAIEIVDRTEGKAPQTLAIENKSREQSVRAAIDQFMLETGTDEQTAIRYLKPQIPEINDFVN